MKKGLVYLFIASSIFSPGCAYDVHTSLAPALDIASTYESKMPGRFTVQIDNDLANISRKVKATSHICAAHTYPVEIGDTLKASILATLQGVFDNVEEVNTPSVDSTANVQIRLGYFEPRLTCQMGFWAGSCNSSTELALKVGVQSRGQKLLETRIGASRTFDGASGAYCGGAADVVAESIRLTFREAMEQLGEKLSNSNNLRMIAGQGHQNIMPTPQIKPEIVPFSPTEQGNHSGAEREVDQKILDYCNKNSSGSYALLKACIDQEEKAKRDLGM